MQNLDALPIYNASKLVEIQYRTLNFRLRKNHQGLSCDSCNNYFNPYYANQFKHRINKRSYLFQRIIEIQYNYCLVDYDAEEIFKLIKTDSKTLSDKRKILLQTMKSHIKFNRDLNYILPQR